GMMAPKKAKLEHRRPASNDTFPDARACSRGLRADLEGCGRSEQGITLGRQDSSDSVSRGWHGTTSLVALRPDVIELEGGTRVERADTEDSGDRLPLEPPPDDLPSLISDDDIECG